MTVPNEFWIVNNEFSMQEFKKHMDSLHKEHGYLVVTWKTGKQRSIKQNSALHVWTNLVAEALNSAGYDMKKTLAHKAEIPWTASSVKDYLWRPVQQAQTGEDSTAKVDKTDYVKIYDILNRHFVDKMGIHVPWPVNERDL
jgi:hypothetical protein